MRPRRIAAPVTFELGSADTGGLQCDLDHPARVIGQALADAVGDDSRSQQDRGGVDRAG